MKYKVLIVDDEEPARDLLVNYVNKIEEVEIIGILDNAFDAQKIINNEKVDILLTDIQMDDLTGLDLMKILKNPPVTIFTTAYSEYALEGYALDVVDYLVKPISFQRFYKAIQKALELINYTHLENKSDQTLRDSEKKNLKTEYFFVKTNRKLVKVNFDEILFVQSFGEYVKIYTQTDVILALQTTSFMEDLLPQEDFIRIHRSHIINLKAINEIEGNLVMIEQHKLPISKRMKDKFMETIRAKGII